MALPLFARGAEVTFAPPLIGEPLKIQIYLLKFRTPLDSCLRRDFMGLNNLTSCARFFK